MHSAWRVHAVLCACGIAASCRETAGNAAGTTAGRTAGTRSGGSCGLGNAGLAGGPSGSSGRKPWLGLRCDLNGIRRVGTDPSCLAARAASFFPPSLTPTSSAGDSLSPLPLSLSLVASLFPPLPFSLPCSTRGRPAPLQENRAGEILNLPPPQLAPSPPPVPQAFSPPLRSLLSAFHLLSQ